MIASEGYTTADDAEADSYRHQSAECRAAMHATLAGGWPHAATVLAVQAVRSSANAVLAARAGISATEHSADAIALLYQQLPRYRTVPALAWGAEVLALEEDLHYYAFEQSAAEARQTLVLADAFCHWASSA